MHIGILERVSYLVVISLSFSASVELVWKQQNIQGDYVIKNGDTVYLGEGNKVSGELIIAKGGKLLVKEDSEQVSLEVSNIEVFGEFRIGTMAKPFNRKAKFILSCGSKVIQSDDRRKGINVRKDGSLFLFGEKGSVVSYTKLSQTAVKGETCLHFVDKTPFSVGDEIVITTTDFDPHQSEKKKIVGISNECVKIDSALKFMHYGKISEGVDQRAEVALLSRNILFEGCQENGQDKAIGGHMKFFEGFKKVQIKAVELVNFGQGDEIGRYPLHFHVAGKAPKDTFLQHNSIHNSNFRAIVIHGTQGTKVDSNVAYNITGHSIMLEDGAEYDNTITRNLMICVRQKLYPARLGSDDRSGLSGFYITNGDNIISNNIVAGVEGTGYWIHTRLRVKGISYRTGKYNNILPYKSKLRECNGNIAHSMQFAFKVDSANFDGKDFPVQENSPSANYNPDDLVTINGFLAYKARHGGWFRMLRLKLDNWIVADVTEGVQMLTQGNLPTSLIETYVENSLFVGGSSNRGNPIQNEWQYINALEQRTDSAIERSDDSRVAIMLYDGPIYLKNLTFSHWYSQTCLNYINPALGARPFNTFMMSTLNDASDLHFKKTDYRIHVSDRSADGGKTTSLVDRTGSISGIKNAWILPDWDFYYTSICHRNLYYGMACPHSYANIEVVAVDTDTNPAKYGNLNVFRNNFVGKTPPKLKLQGQYIPASSGWLYHPSLSNGASYLFSFNKYTPKEINIVVANAEKDDIYETAICYPKKSSIISIVDHQNKALLRVAGQSYKSCTNCYFYDAKKDILILRIKQLHSRDKKLPCPRQGCQKVNIKAQLTSSTGVDNCEKIAYGSSSLQVEDIGLNSWLGKKFAGEGFPVDTPKNFDWCKTGDKCLTKVSQGNRRQGILAFTQKPCASIGCFSNECRYCTLEHSNSNHGFPVCPFKPNDHTPIPSFSTPAPTQSSTPAPMGTRTPVTTAATPHPSSAMTPTPTQSSSSPSPTATLPANMCMKLVSFGDKSVGISAFEDSTCATVGGVGCLPGGKCRFCKKKETISSAHFIACPSMTDAPTPIATPKPTPQSTPNSSPLSTPKPTPSSTAKLTPIPTPVQKTPKPKQNKCAEAVSSGDKAVGISSYEDLTCGTRGGIGCLGNGKCRLCKARHTVQSAAFKDCPSSSIPSTSTPTPVSSNNTPAPGVDCPGMVSVGDKNAGVSAHYDSKCARIGGLGCFPAKIPCRFCRLKSNKNSNYVVCKENKPATSPPHIQTTAPSSSTPESYNCKLHAENLNIKGVSAVLNKSCGNAVGCFSNGFPCQFCRNEKTEENKHLLTCKTLKNNAMKSPQNSTSGGTTSNAQGTSFSSSESVQKITIDGASYVGFMILILSITVGIIFLVKKKMKLNKTTCTNSSSDEASKFDEEDTI